MTTALILCHKSTRDSGAFEAILQERGVKIETRLAFDEGVKDVDPKAHDLVMFMGGPMGVYQADMFPYLYDEIKFIEKRLESEKPYIGVCLGGQLMAAAMGSEVFKGEAGKEIGWHSIKANEAGMNSPVRHLDESLTPMMQWHGDTFNLPKEATLLASSAQYKNQAMSYGKNALGLQCHPEVTATNIELWLALGIKELKEIGSSVEKMRSETLENLKKLEKQRALFFNEWLDEAGL